MAEREQYDRSTKWLLQHHGDSILRLGGVGPVESWRALQADIVHPRRLPDGLLEVTLAGRTVPDLFLVEIATYAERRVPDQLADDIALVLLERRMLPEVLTVVLHTRGNARVGDSHELRSRLGWTRLAVAWRVVELWNVPAEQLLAVNDIGLIPWVPLAQFSDPPAVMLQECRRRIDQQSAPQEHANLLAVTQVLTQLR